MLKFLPGLVLLQAITASLMLLAPEHLAGWGWLRLIIPLGIVATLMAFWFNSLAKHVSKDEIMQLREAHARERENIRVNAERAKHQITKDAQKQVQQEIRRTTAQANFKVGAAFAGAVSVGGLLLLTQFMTLGILVLTTAGGTLGGYLLRMKQEKQTQAARLAADQGAQPRLINPANKQP